MAQCAIAPVSSALHLGATRVLVIGVNNMPPDDASSRNDIGAYPSLRILADMR